MTSEFVLLVETFAAVTAAMLYQTDTRMPIREISLQALYHIFTTAPRLYKTLLRSL
ncbi:MAG TPA: hypothetical protein V6D50_22835 [Chroococcales cyanobacterium]